MCDRKWGDSATTDLHHKLYSQSYPHPGDVFYVLLCRVILGHQVQTDSNNRVQPNVFAAGGTIRRELAVIPGSKPPTPYHSLLGTHYPRFREFVSFNSTYLYPEYLVAYHRVPPTSAPKKTLSPPPASRLQPPRSTAATGGSNTAPLLQKPNLGLLPVPPQSGSAPGWSWWAPDYGGPKLFGAVLIMVAIVAGGVVGVERYIRHHSLPVCTGSSADLTPVECGAWQDLFDSLNGPDWDTCVSDPYGRPDPCSCSNHRENGIGVTCTGGHITAM
jgi:hypothetical protein